MQKERKTHILEIQNLMFLFFLLNFQEGSIGHDVVIKPLPYGVLQQDDETKGAHHVVFKRKTDETDQFGDYGKFRIILM